MKLFIASYYWSGRYGAREEKEYIVVAETESVALGLVLEACPDTSAKYWTLNEIPLENAEAHYVSSRSV